MTEENRDSRRPALIATTLGSFIIPFMGSSINIALPAIGKEFGLDALLLSWVTTSYLLTVAMCLVPSGRIADIYGRKRIFLYGILLYTVSSLLSALSTSASLLIAFRVFQGIGASMTFSTGVAILTSVYPPGEKGRVLGINVSAVYAGLSCGPFLGGLLTGYFGWRSIFLFNIPAGFIILFYTIYRLKGEWAEAKGETFDYMGSLFYGLVLLMVMFGLFRLPSLLGAFLILSGLIGVWVFIRWEMRSESPVFKVSLFRKNRIFAFSSLAALINYSATFAVSFLLSLYLQWIKGLQPHTAGIVLISAPLMQAIVSPFAGKLSDRIEPRKVASTGMAITTVALLFFAFLDERTALPLIVAFLIFLGFGFALFSSPNTNAAMGSVDKRFYGVASGTLGTTRVVGMMFSMGVVMMAFSIFMEGTRITSSDSSLFLKSMRLAFVLFTFLCMSGIWASLARGTSEDPSPN